MNLLRIVLMDLRRVSKDWQAVLWLLAMPLLFVFIFGSAFRDRGPQSSWMPVIDLDRSDLSGLILEQLRGEGCIVDIKGANDQAELKKNWPYGVVIPAGFGSNILKAEAVKLTVVKGWESPQRILEVQARLTHAILRFTKALAITDSSHREWNDESKRAFKAALASPDLLTVVSKEHRSLRPPPSGFFQSLPGMLVMFVMQMVLTYGGVTLVQDRTRGQFARLLAAPVFAFEVFLGKILARVLLALAQAALLLLCGRAMFGIPPRRSPLVFGACGVVVCLVCGVFLAF